MENIKVPKDSIFKNLIHALTKGNIVSKLSCIVMGLGCVLRGQIVKGLLYLALQLTYLTYMATYGLDYLSKIGTLGTAAQTQIWNEELQIYENVPGDNSMLILLFSVITIVISIAMIIVYAKSVSESYYNEQLKKAGKKPNSFIEDLKSLFDNNFHKTLLTLPALGVICTVILPIIFMILIAFTNFDKTHQPPGKLFTWVGLENFKNIFWNNPLQSHTFTQLFIWTIIWAICATFSNYILGMILAIMINKKGIKFKGFWRTIFVLTIAVPQFVTLLLMSRMLQELGPVNVLLQNLGWIKEPIKFLTDGTNAKLTVIIVNMWIGIPYTMLITSGILMNIPEELYESAKIDGAGPVTIFRKITLPYMLFVTTPYLITQFIGNINNFNVIFLLTGGGPMTLKYFQAGETDLLVTWLYKLTVNEQNYSLASTIGIIVFVISATLSLITYNRSASVQKEDTFQ
ncbi:carbohydrate ABC transporter permease [Clostridium thermarum]|uniref:carbohydrate ABC transporter permease n=1 Tax=Clostridium thermarum TaxID=1716543 RepID=UPI001FAA1E02|nr:sugar ABC transporter permease [Clostridium thermarum]